MAESEGIEEIVKQSAVQAATATVMTFRDMDTRSQPTPQQTKGNYSDTTDWYFEFFIQLDCPGQVC